MHQQTDVDERVARANDLHRSAIVIDTEAPVFTSQMMFTPGMKALASDMLAAGKSRAAVKFALGEKLYEEIRDDVGIRESYVKFWERSGVTATSSSIYDVGHPWTAWEESLHELSTATKMVAELSELLGAALCAGDITKAHSSGRHVVIHNLQNTDPLDDQLDRVDLLYGMGVRIVQVTYNLRNRFGDGCLERRDGGLSRFGEALVGKLNDSGILIDLSHSSDQTVMDALAASARPVACTHTSARALSSHARGKPDNVLRAVGEKGGYIGVLLVPFFILSPHGDPRAQALGLPPGNATLETMIDHVMHVIDVAGSDAVGIGTDWSKPFQDALRVASDTTGIATRSRTAGFDWVGWRPEDRYSREVYTAGFESWDKWPNITAALLGRGLSEDLVSKVIGGNFLRVFGEACG